MTISASAPLRLLVLLTSVAMALLLLLSGVVSAHTDGSAVGEIEATHIEHVVVPGDTLWDIASGFTAPGDDVRRTIHDITVASGLPSSSIAVGDVLRIPIEF